jgi:hypothetical protein
VNSFRDRPVERIAVRLRALRAKHNSGGNDCSNQHPKLGHVALLD